MSFHRVELSQMVTTTLCAAGSFSSYEERASGRDGCYGLTECNGFQDKLATSLTNKDMRDA